MLNFYLYSVTSISLAAFYFAAVYLVSGVLRFALGVDADDQVRTAIASGLGIVVAALPLWVVHWRWLREQFRQARPEDVAFHRFYLFTIVCISALALLVSGSVAVTRLMNIALGVGPDTTLSAAHAATAFATFMLSLTIWLLHWGQFQGGRGEMKVNG
ncbi:MAG: hypothetical protein KBG20_17650 [Caldilineaceae bacterium]|nr:hypothetical protein [Caldilineaceae bacterium]MBP8125200.1 hypothetical protein [Caldilineaceae bacterium]MBP9074135.1 hypothetical protein [Caldilineaceae bacterium]